MGEGSVLKGWQQDKRWSDQFLPGIKRILGEHLISEPPIEEDQERNTDLIVLRLDAVRIGCRMRKTDYMDRYGDEFTIRAGRPSGVKTELTKIIEGWGNYFFYGFGKSGVIEKWTLADLNVFRLWFNHEIVKNKGVVPGKRIDNHDGSSHFRPFKWCDLPDKFIVARDDRCLKFA